MMNRNGKLLVSLAALTLGMLMSFGMPAHATDKFTPTSDFIDNGDGTVTHKLTDLTWMRCSMGQTWTGATCSGEATAYSWNQATSLGELCFTATCPALWRLPSPWELATIVDYDISVPAINATIFPDTTTSSGFWSSFPLANE